MAQTLLVLSWAALEADFRPELDEGWFGAESDEESTDDEADEDWDEDWDDDDWDEGWDEEEEELEESDDLEEMELY